RALDAVAAPVHGAHLAAPERERVTRRVDPPTDAACPRGHRSVRSSLPRLYGRPDAIMALPAPPRPARPPGAIHVATTQAGARGCGGTSIGSTRGSGPGSGAGSAARTSGTARAVPAAAVPTPGPGD